jgi:hypothetical protein
MYKIISFMMIFVLILSFTVFASCGGGTAETTNGKTTQTNNTAGQTTTTGNQTGNVTTGASSGPLRNSNWLLGTWEATVPKTNDALFTGKKIILKIADVMLVSDEKVQGNPTGLYSYSGNLIWDVGGDERTIEFIKTNQLSGDSTITWSYLSPGANQFTENISLRVYGGEWYFELDWGPQLSKPGSSIKSLSFYGDIQNIDTSEREVFDPKNMITFKQTSTSAPVVTSSAGTTTGTASGTKTSIKTSASATTTTQASQGTGDVWKDVPFYPGIEEAEDGGFSLSMPGDPEFTQAEWRFYTSTDDYEKVVDFYKKQIPANGWDKMMWMDSDEMSWGSFERNNQSRLLMVYIINEEGGVGINIHSLAK